MERINLFDYGPPNRGNLTPNQPPFLYYLGAPDVNQAIALAREELQINGRQLLPESEILLGIHKNVSNALLESKPLPVHDDLMSLISSEKILTLAYAKIGRNTGAPTPGPKGQSADSMSLDRIQTLSQSLKDGTFKWSPLKRVMVPKTFAKKDPITGIIPERPLSVPEFEDRLVQEAIRLTLTAIYEPVFEIQNVSFGFRPHKSTHDAMNVIRYHAQSSNYVVEGDIKGAFDNVNKDIMDKILRKRIKDKKFLGIIKSGFSCGLINPKGEYEDTFLGTPQGGIASPILFNIYMQEFDTFVMEELRPWISKLEVTIGRAKRLSSEYTTNDPTPKTKWEQLNTRKRTLQARLQRHNRGETISPDLVLEALEELPKITKEMSQIPKITSTHSTVIKGRVCYVRYADDWIFLTNLDKRVCETVKERCSVFLKEKLGLTLSPEKTIITDIRGKNTPARFLGFEIYRKVSKRMAAITVRHSSRTNTHSPKPPSKEGNTEPEPNQPDGFEYKSYRAIGRNNLVFGIDKKRVTLRMAHRLYMTESGKPREAPHLSVLTEQEIVTKFNSIMLGFANYYHPVITYRSHLNYWTYILYYSCLKTLATKLRKTIYRITKDKSYLDYEHILLSRIKGTVRFRENPTHTNQRIVIEYKQDNDVKRVVLMNYKELMARCRIIQYNTRILKPYSPTVRTDFLISHKLYWRTQFKLSTCCIVCGCDKYIENDHLRHIKKDPKAKGFSAIMAILQRRQVPLCRWCHANVHKGIYNNIALADLYDRKVAVSENLIKAENAPWNDPRAEAKVKLGDRIISIKTDEAYAFDHVNRQVRSRYIEIDKQLSKTSAYNQS